jgi:hypothetical protein
MIGPHAAVNGEIRPAFPNAMNRWLQKTKRKNSAIANATPPSTPRRE